MSGPKLGALSNNRWLRGIFDGYQRNKMVCWLRSELGVVCLGIADETRGQHDK